MIYEFGDFMLDTRRHELRRAGTPLHLEPQVHAVLCHLVENGDRLVSSKELIEHVWGQRFITPGTLNSRIKALRHALGDDGTTQCVIQTIRGRGFRIGIEVKGRAEAPRSSAVPRPEQRIRFCTAHDGIRIAYSTTGDPTGPALVKPAN
jgi:DNA-binding winged helix-turn-helix (wHTH) protein